MKTKNIFKTLAFAMLMPTMLLTTACSSEDDVVNSNLANIETVANKGYALPVTVNVTREGDATMRAAFDGSKLNFGEGDKLFVKGNDYSAGGTGFFAGTLTWQSGGTFSGTILTENPYSGTIDDLFKAVNNPLATLLPANYGNYSYLYFTNKDTYSASLMYDITKTFATSKATAVEQFSFEVGGYTSGTGFALHPANAILNFTITGLAASTNVTATLTNGSSRTISGEVTTNASGTATFAIGVYGYTDLNEFSLTVAGNPIILVSSEKTLDAGKIYNVTRSALTYPIALSAVTSGYLGSVVTSDGYVYAKVADATAVSKTAVAKITYVGSETGVAGKTHGLALSLSNVSTANYYWATAISACASKTPAVTNASSWMLPSKDQWTKMIDAAGGYKALRNGFSGVGGTNLNSGTYWSSTDYTTEGNAWAHKFKDSGGGWAAFAKNTSSEKYTRACIAF